MIEARPVLSGETLAVVAMMAGVLMRIGRSRSDQQRGRKEKSAVELHLFLHP
ncbi:hypothetical protein [Methylocapsa palsarum]|uniref:hypothetical protein n=1 Tax=Methylocapsa palsarum TaxID=1612308 RepID=UPI0015870253|nr:hypothetical protein [Methylocapsa palsarum]